MKKFTIIALLLGSLSISDLNLSVQAESLDQLTSVGQLEERKIEILRELNSLKHLASAGNIASNPNLKVNLNDITNSYQKLTQEMKEINDKIKLMEESPPELDVSLGLREEPKAQIPEVSTPPVAEVAALETPAENKAEIVENKIEEQPIKEESVVQQILEGDSKIEKPETQEILVEEKVEVKAEEPVQEQPPAEIVAPQEEPKIEEAPKEQEIKVDDIVPEKDEISTQKEEPEQMKEEEQVSDAPPITAEEPTDFSVTIGLLFVAFTVLFAITKALENKSPSDLGIGQQSTYGNLFDGGKRAGYSSMSRGSEMKSIDNIYNSWSQDKNIGNRQRSSRLIQIDDESVSI